MMLLAMVIYTLVSHCGSFSLKLAKKEEPHPALSTVDA